MSVDTMEITPVPNGLSKLDSNVDQQMSGDKQLLLDQLDHEHDATRVEEEEEVAAARDVVKNEKSERPEDKTSSSKQNNEIKEKDEKFLKELEDLDNEEESALRWQSIGSYYYNQGPLEVRVQNAPKRLLQYKAYAELLEDRLQDLEEKVRGILNLPKPDTSNTKSAKPPVSLLEITEMGWAKFGVRNEVEIKGVWKHRPEVDTRPKSVIEVLTEEPRYTFGSRMTVRSNLAQNGSENSADTVSSEEKEVVQSVASVRDGKSSMPHRIRIRSPLLLKLINEVTGLNTVVGPHKHILLLFRPFKLLVAYAEDLRKKLQQLDTALPVQNGESKLLVVKSPNPSEIDPKKETENEPKKETEIGPKKETETDEAKEELRLLCTLLERYLQPNIQMRSHLDSSLKTVAFNELWYIFKPGDEIRTPGKSQIQLYRILRVTGGREVLAKWKEPPANSASLKLKQNGYSQGSFIIECFYIHFDGNQFGPVNVTFQIRKFEGKRDITSLPVIPFNCDPRKVEARNRLLERGNKFAQLSRPDNPAHRKYKGLSLGERQEQVESEVIIDFQLAFIETPKNKPEIGLDGLVDDDEREIDVVDLSCTACGLHGCCGNDIIHGDYEVDEKDRGTFQSNHKSIFDTTDQYDQLSDDQKVLLPYKVYGFTLRSRRWDIFDIDLLNEVDYEGASGWSNLVIDNSIKETVLALVQNHERPQGTQDRFDGALTSVDLVQGKGKGLIILLHGEPGVGKTSTAECVADHTHRPLFPITCGDIGETAQMVESNLEKNFQLAHKWGCVLLLDEADIFLSKRTTADVARNAIVSVFLRSLEYYSGILFLTTNRVGIIDRAFKSRIHLTLYYPKLDKSRTTQIWENNMARLEKEFESEGKVAGKDFIFDKKNVIKFARKHYDELEKKDLLVWNGRQIRNAFQTAVAIATYEAKSASPPQVALGVSQFKKVAKTARKFDEYLQELSKGKNDADLAQDAGLRVDDWQGYNTEFKLVRSRTEPIRRTNHRSKHRKDSPQTASDSESDSKSESGSETDSKSGSDSEADHKAKKGKSQKRNRSDPGNSSGEGKRKKRK